MDGGLEIRRVPDAVLRKKASPVTVFDCELTTFAERMVRAMRKAHGIGLAAPQVGVSWRIIVVGTRRKPLTLVNPEILEAKGIVVGEESCLSVPGVSAKVKRARSVVVHAWTLGEKEIDICAGGLLAVVLQHEIDHLDGVLFIDRLGERGE